MFAASALVRAHRGRIEEAQRDLPRRRACRPRSTDFAPWYEAELRILSPAPRSGSATSPAPAPASRRGAASLRRAPEAVVAQPGSTRRGASSTRSTPPTGAPPASLTAAELRILRFLPTHLSFREIAERTYVSANTVKSQANAVYRKFDVGSRSDAVARARELGLLDPS